MKKIDPSTLEPILGTVRGGFLDYRDVAVLFEQMIAVKNSYPQGQI